MNYKVLTSESTEQAHRPHPQIVAHLTVSPNRNKENTKLTLPGTLTTEDGNDITRESSVM